ncbi:DNA helicase [Halovulum sp. GXIMD14793]
MRLSAPIYMLKRKAKQLVRNTSTPLHAALDQIAIAEGFQAWSHLTAHTANTSKAGQILETLTPGDLMVLAARPTQGKTMLGLKLAAEAQETGRTALFFTLCYTEADVARRFNDLQTNADQADAVRIDTSNDISADYVIGRMRETSGPALAVIDYLQLLDQRRTSPAVEDQVIALKAHAQKSGDIFVLISQIDRRFEVSGRSMPDLTDLYLPNPLDVSLFDKTCFLHNGDIQLATAA